MKKIYSVILSLIMLLSSPLLVHAKTTIDFSFKTRNMTISETQAVLLEVSLVDLITPILTELSKKELIDDVMVIIVTSFHRNVLDIILRDVDGDKIPDLIDDPETTLLDYLIAHPDSLINPSMDATKELFAQSLADNMDLWILNTLLEDAKKALGEAIFDLAEKELRDALIDYLVEDLIDDANQDLDDFLTEIPQYLEKMIWDELPDLLVELIEEELPELLEDLLIGLLPRNFSVYVIALEIRTDLTEYFSLGAGIKGVSVDTLFIPELSLSAHYNFFRTEKVNSDAFISFQTLIMPASINNIFASQIGTNLSFRPFNLLSIDGQFAVGYFFGNPFGGAIPNLFINYSLGLSLYYTKDSHLRVSYSQRGLSDLAVTFFDTLVKNDHRYGWLTFTAGFNF